MIQETIKNFLQQHHISRDAGFILAVSGGADSICMLHVIQIPESEDVGFALQFFVKG